MQPTAMEQGASIRTNAATLTPPHLWDSTALTNLMLRTFVYVTIAGRNTWVHDHAKRLTRFMQEEPHWNPPSTR